MGVDTGAVLAVVHKGAHSLGFYDYASGELLEEVRLASFPHEAARSPNGRLLYACHFGVALAEDKGPGGHTVSVVDLAARRLVKSIDCAPYNKPHGVDIDRQGRIYVASEGTSQLLIIEAEKPIRAMPTNGQGSHIVTVSGDGTAVFVSNMWSDSVSILAPDEPEAPPVVVAVDARPEGSVLDAARRCLLVACRESGSIVEVDVDAGAVARRIETPPGPVRLAWGAHGALLAAMYHDQSLLVLAPQSMEIIARVPVPNKPVAVSFDSATNTVCLSTLGDRVYVVDLGNNAVDRVVETKADPDPTFVLWPDRA